MIVIGVDPHKATYAVAAVDVATGRVVGVETFASTSLGVLRLRQWAHECASRDSIAFAVEDNRRLTRRLEVDLLRERERVLRVPARLTARRRVRDPERGKSDVIDARSIARAAVEQGLDTLAAATTDPAVDEVRVLVAYRSGLVTERVRCQQRLRWLLLEFAPDWEATIGHGRPLAGRTRRALVGHLAALRGVQADIAARHVQRISDLTTEIDDLDHSLGGLVAQACPQLVQIHGCGVITAATLIARASPAGRFATADQFARYTGTAPIPAGSGQSARLTVDRGGDRQINAALHQIAITQARSYPPASAYVARKQREGKTRRQAIRCLKRHIARRVWHVMTAPGPDEASRVLARMAELAPLVVEYQELRDAARRVRRALR